MGQLVYILGRSGTGKSYSMRNFTPDELAIINVEGKILPFRGAAKYHTINTDDSKSIIDALDELAKTYKRIVIDDFQYVMANEFMRRATDVGFQKFTDIACHAWDIANKVRSLPADVIVYIMCHTDIDAEGNERLKTIGKLLDEKIVLEGMSTIVLKTNVTDFKYSFLTQNNGNDTTKSPEGMFASYSIENDLKFVDDKIRNYYGFDGAKSDDELAAADKEKAGDVAAPAPRVSRSERKAKETIEAVDAIAGDREEVSFDEVAQAIENKPQKRTRKVREEK